MIFLLPESAVSTDSGQVIICNCHLSVATELPCACACVNPGQILGHCLRTVVKYAYSCLSHYELPSG